MRGLLLPNSLFWRFLGFYVTIMDFVFHPYGFENFETLGGGVMSFFFGKFGGRQGRVSNLFGKFWGLVRKFHSTRVSGIKKDQPLSDYKVSD